MFDQKEYPNCHRGHEYAEQVVRGEILVCKYTLGACKRYLREVEPRSSEIYYFNANAAERFLRLVQKFDHVIGNWDTKNLKFEPWQCFIWMNIMGFHNYETDLRRFRIAHLELARANGKAHWIGEKVPTPSGIKRWDEIHVGSLLYDRNGGICEVIGKTATTPQDAYRVTFSDNTETVCSWQHLWHTSTKVERSRETRHRKNPPGYSSAKTHYEGVRSTLEIMATLKTGGASPERNHSVRNTAPVLGVQVSLPINPYVLGYWLGNGSKANGNITFHEDDEYWIRSLFKERGHPLGDAKPREGTKGVTALVSDLHVALKSAGILNNKHIPSDYFIASVEDRLELVRGLMDSDGSIGSNSQGQAEITQKDADIAMGVDRLLCSLGYKTCVQTFQVNESNNFSSDATFTRILFTPRGGSAVFNLPRKRIRQKPSSAGNTCTEKRYITSVEKLEHPLYMFCVEVDSPDNSYLITEKYIPTHNSAMASAAALYFLALDAPKGNMIATAATKKEQARIVLDSARAMAMANRSFLRKKKVKVRAHDIVQDHTNSKIRALSSEAKSLDGLNDVLAVLDELHAMNRDTFEVIYSGMIKRKDSLTLCITTAGFNQNSVGYSQSQYAKSLLREDSKITDDQFFAIIYTLDKEDDVFDPKAWPKANPNWGISVDPITFLARMQKAQTTPADLPGLKVKQLNMWLSEAEAFFSQAKWDDCADPTLRIEDFKGERCRLGIDLASHLDLTSRVAIFKREDKFYLFDKTWIPEQTVKEQRNVLYDDCIAKGFLYETPGVAINNDHIREDTELFLKDYRAVECMYDTWNATEMASNLAEKVEMVKFAMNVGNFSEPMKKMDTLIREKRLVHNGSPLLRWCIGNVVAKRDHNGNVFPRKNHERLKIDPVVAALMALGGWLNDEDETSVYEGRGLRTV